MRGVERTVRSIGAVAELRETPCQASPFALFENLTWQERCPGLVAGMLALIGWRKKGSARRAAQADRVGSPD